MLSQLRRPVCQVSGKRLELIDVGPAVTQVSRLPGPPDIRRGEVYLGHNHAVAVILVVAQYLSFGVRNQSLLRMVNTIRTSLSYARVRIMHRFRSLCIP